VWHLGYGEEFNPTNFGFDEFCMDISAEMLIYHSSFMMVRNNMHGGTILDSLRKRRLIPPI